MTAPFAYVPTTRVRADLHAEDDCTVDAAMVPSWPGRAVVHMGPLTVFGTLDTLRRLAAEMTSAVAAIDAAEMAAAGEMAAPAGAA